MATKLLALLIGAIALYLCGLWALTWGWGLTVKDWGGVIIPQIVGMTMYFICTLIAKMPSDE